MTIRKGINKRLQIISYIVGISAVIMCLIEIITVINLADGMYEFIAPDVNEIVPYLLDQNVAESNFVSLQDVWGTRYCMTTMLVWREQVHERARIRPCKVWMGGEDFAPVLVFGPFEDWDDLNRFRGCFDALQLPRYSVTDSVTIRMGAQDYRGTTKVAVRK